jgi:hypothetical protein
MAPLSAPVCVVGVAVLPFLPSTPGRIWLQTLPVSKLAHAIEKYLPREAARQAVEGGVVGGIVGSILDNMR